MSSKRGPPKHQNRVAWVPNRNVKKKDSELGSKRNPYANIAAVCPRCHDQIAWRRKYGKYKPLTEPAKCGSCTRRTVKDAYHAICRECATQQKVCAKCRKPSDAIIPDNAAVEEEERKKLEEALANLRERDRRTLLREMAKPGGASAVEQKLSAKQVGSDDDDDDGDDNDDDGDGDDDDDDDDDDEEDDNNDAAKDEDDDGGSDDDDDKGGNGENDSKRDGDDNPESERGQ